jgi:hypothetical protein
LSQGCLDAAIFRIKYLISSIQLIEIIDPAEIDHSAGYPSMLLLLPTINVPATYYLQAFKT